MKYVATIFRLLSENKDMKYIMNHFRGHVTPKVVLDCKNSVDEKYYAYVFFTLTSFEDMFSKSEFAFDVIPKFHLPIDEDIKSIQHSYFVSEFGVIKKINVTFRAKIDDVNKFHLYSIKVIESNLPENYKINDSQSVLDFGD